MGVDGGTTVSVSWTRAELVAVREALEVTPGFGGRSDVRAMVREAARARRVEPVVLGLETAVQLCRGLAPTDLATAVAKAKLQQAVRPYTRPSGAARVAAR